MLPRVLIVDLAVGYGGSSSRVLNLLKTLPEGTVALAGIQGGGLPEKAKELGLPTYVIPRDKRDPRVVNGLVDIIRKGDFQLIDAQNIQSKLWGSRAVARTGIGFISTLNSWPIAEHGGSLKGRFFQFIENTTNANLDLYITVSTKDTKELLSRNMAEEKIALILNAVDITPDAVTGDREQLIAAHGLSPDAFICAAAGRLVWQKGYPDLIEAVASIKDEIPELVCLVCGDGFMQQEIEGLMQKYGVEKHIKLLGFRPREETLSIVKASDVFLMPSRYEGTPVALLEAAALEKPIAATLAGGIPDLVTHEEHALLTPIQDPEAYAESILRLQRDPEFAHHLGQQAGKYIKEVFGLEAQANATAEAYKKAYENFQKRNNNSS